MKSLVRDHFRERKSTRALTAFQREADESYAQIAHFAMAVRPFRAFRSFQADKRCGLQEITTVAEKVRVSPLVRHRWQSRKGKKVLDVDIYARDTEGTALREQHCHGMVR